MVNIESNSRMNSLMVSFFFILILFSLLLGGCEKEKLDYTEKGSITGHAFDAETNQAIANVTVTTEPASEAVITDDSGNFTISSVTSGEVMVTAERKNYRTTTLNVFVEKDEVTEVTLVMEQNDQSLSVTLGNPSPADQADGLANELTLSWSVASQGNTSDSVFYDVFLLKEGLNKEKVGKDLTDTTLQVQHLKYNTSYSWQVVAKNSDDDVVERSEMWSFKTMPLPDLDVVYSALVENSYEVFYADTAQNPAKYQITNYQTSSELFPKTSPSGEYLLYSSNRDLGFHLYLSKKDGSEERKILASEIGGYHYQGGRYCWTASDNYIYFASYNKLFKLNVVTGSKQQIAVAPDDYHFGQFDWNENTHSIVAQVIGENINNSKIYTMDEDGENMTIVIDDLPGRIGRPSFSPDGSKFLYTYDVEGFENMEGRMLDSRMVIHTLSNHEEEDISAGSKPNGTNDLMACFSKTGAKVIFVNTPNTVNAKNEIWIANADGSSRQKLIDNASMPSWY